MKNVLLQDREGTTFCVACNDFRDENGGVLDKIEEKEIESIPGKSFLGRINHSHILKPSSISFLF